jgi:hypothetical protein
MMQGWAADLCDRLANHVDLLGLRRDMTGEQFEDRLGAFLRFTRSLRDVASYPRAGLATPAEPTQTIEAWFNQAAGTAQEINRSILESLHELFSGTRVHRTPAEQAYGPLLRALQVERLTYVTTNYDLAGEIALEALGKRPYAGVDQAWSPGDPQLVHLDDLLANDTTRTPVLHLHGRVDWYTTDEGQLVAVDPNAPFNPSLGTPALLLPDPDKVYDDFVTQTIWRHFEVALGQATHVLVLGHSLNDTQLLRALTRVTDQQLAIALHAPEGAGLSQWRKDEAALLQKIGRTPHIIPMDFGPRPCADPVRLQHFLGGGTPPSNATSAVTALPG